MSLSVEEIIRLFKGKSCLVRQKRALEDKMNVLQQELESVKENLLIAERVSRIYKGIPIGGGMNGWCSRVPTAEGKYRSGRVYLNAHNKTTWGIQLHTGIGFHDDVFLGAGYPSHEVANQIVLDFLVTGTILPERQRKY